MIKVENIEVFNLEGAIRGMRNPMNSWDRSDSYYGYDCKKCGVIDRDGFCKPQEHECSEYLGYEVGPNDLDLMKRLYKGGPVHAKYLRQIMVSMDITAPLYWWKEFDTYKVGTTANSCSTMHKIHSKPFELDDFSHEHLFSSNEMFMEDLVQMLNCCREAFVSSNDKRWWWQMIQMLPSSYNQKRTVTMDYQNVMNMLDWRTNHKLDCWVEFCKIMREKLPYIKDIRGEE